jgi:hypothetical protein
VLAGKPDHVRGCTGPFQYPDCRQAVDGRLMCRAARPPRRAGSPVRPRVGYDDTGARVRLSSVVQICSLVVPGSDRQLSPVCIDRRDARPDRGSTAASSPFQPSPTEMPAWSVRCLPPVSHRAAGAMGSTGGLTGRAFVWIHSPRRIRAAPSTAGNRTCHLAQERVAAASSARQPRAATLSRRPRLICSAM